MSIAVETILEILQRGAEETVDLLDSFTGDKYTSYRKMRRSMLHGPRGFKADWADVYRRRQRFYSQLNRLKNDGLVVKKERGRSSFWRITKKGLDKLLNIRKRKNNPYSLYNAKYPKPRGNGFTIVAFDIPERERKKRDWIRSCLTLMDFRCLQKSVWISTGKLEEDFIHALRERGMLDYVHIFSVSSLGTIREID